MPDFERQEALQPTVTSINARIGKFRDKLTPDRGILGNWSKVQDVPPEQDKLREALAATVYDGVSVTAGKLRESLESQTEPGSEYIGPKYERLVRDLDFVELLELGGMDAVNKRLQKRLSSLTSPGSRPDDQTRELNLINNEFLQRAIYLAPHLTTGVEITLKPGALERAQRFERGYMDDFYRDDHRRLARVHQEKKGSPLPDTLVVPLPFSFYTGTHGSGDRTANNISSDTVFLDFMQERKDRLKGTPTVAIALNPWHNTHFALDEVERIRFTNERSFTPTLGVENSVEHLIEVSPELYYLRFREFKPYNKSDWNVLSPNTVGNLWGVNEPVLRRRRLTKGFIAPQRDRRVDGSPLSLYELSDIKLPGGDMDTIPTSLYDRMEAGNKRIISRSQRYQDNNMIRRLTEIPVFQRSL